MRSPLLPSLVLLLLGAVSFIVSSCGVPTTVDPLSPFSGGILPPSSAIQLSPYTTDPPTLNVNANIYEDQTASDGRSQLTLQFSTTEIRNKNAVEFANGEKVTCNGIPLLFKDGLYSARVGAVNGLYQCTYQWASGTATILSILARTHLSPEVMPDPAGHVFQVRYNPDLTHQCPISVEISDNAQSIRGPTSLESGDGLYTGPNISALTGSGTLVMTRICTFTLLRGPRTDFAAVNATYTSTATSDVTWFSAPGSS